MLIAILRPAGAPDAETAALGREADASGAELIVADWDAGPIAAANAALVRARDERRDLLLIEAGTTLAAGGPAELRMAAALDPMIGFVNAWGGVPASARHLPRASYAVRARGGCVFVRHAMAIEFGLLDEGFATLDAAIADLSLSANRCGYRAVVAHRAPADSLLRAEDAADGARLRERHPTLDRALARHEAGSAARAEALVAALAPGGDGRLGLLFDCRAMHPYFSGTHEHARRLLVAFVARHAGRYRCHVLIGEEGWRFHRLSAIAGLEHVAPGAAPPDPIAIAFRLAQPFDGNALASLAAMAPVPGFLMLDTIALDCQHLDDAGLAELWQEMADCVAMLGFNSQFSRDQFNRRFAVPADVVQRVSLCSTDVADYGVPAAGSGDGVLMVGNHYPHKALATTLSALAAHGAAGRTTVMGLELEGAAAGYHAGGLPQDFVDGLYDGAGVLLFPSHYEGFGLPVMNALARHRPVVARDLPCLREIAWRTPHGRNIHRAADTPALAALAADPPRWIDGETDAPAHDWGAAADALADGFADALGRFDFGACRRRLSRIAMRERSDGLAARAEAIRRERDDAHREAADAMREAALRSLLASDAAIRFRWGNATADTLPRATIDLREADGDALVPRLLDAVTAFAPGRRLLVRLPATAAGEDARVALFAVGIRPEGVVRRYGRVSAKGVLASRWTDLLALAPGDDALFDAVCEALGLGASQAPPGGSRRDALRARLLARRW